MRLKHNVYNMVSSDYQSHNAINSSIAVSVAYHLPESLMIVRLCQVQVSSVSQKVRKIVVHFGVVRQCSNSSPGRQFISQCKSLSISMANKFTCFIIIKPCQRVQHLVVCHSIFFLQLHLIKNTVIIQYRYLYLMKYKINKTSFRNF